MTEATPINQDYFVLNAFAKHVERDTKLSTSDNVEGVLKGMGGIINYYNYNENNNKMFVDVLGSNNFNIYLLNGLDKDFKRLLIIQSLGHYMLHGDSGKRICSIKRDKCSKVFQEGFLFTLSLLVPDDLFLEVHERYKTDYLATLFRVPKFAIESKQKVINKIYLNKE